MTAPSWSLAYICTLTKKRSISSLLRPESAKSETSASLETNAPANLKGKYQASITCYIDSCHTILDTHYISFSPDS